MPFIPLVSALPAIRRPLRVLLVDDAPADRLLAREAFDGHSEQVVIDTCASGERALSHLRNVDNPLPDVLLLDINMPGLSGFEVLCQMKDDPRLNLIPVVMLSSSRDSGDIEQAYSLHASSYLIKSLDFRIFLAQIDAFVGFWMQARTVHWPE